MTMYQLNLYGFAPTYYYNKEEATEKYLYLKKYCSRCSLRKINYYKMLSKIYK